VLRLRTAAGSAHSHHQAQTIARLAKTAAGHGRNRSGVRVSPLRRKTAVATARLHRRRGVKRRAGNPAAVATTGIGRHPVPARSAAIRKEQAAERRDRNWICANRSCAARLMGADIPEAGTAVLLTADRAVHRDTPGRVTEAAVAAQDRHPATAEAATHPAAAEDTTVAVEVEVTPAAEAAAIPAVVDTAGITRS
jgi:hypothetical protein